MDKKAICSQSDDQKKETAEAAEKAAKAGLVNRLYVHLGQKVGIVEWTKLEPRFERNIDKLISYHNIVFKIVDSIEMQVQVNPRVLAAKKVVNPPDDNPWEILGGWINFLSVAHFEGTQGKMMEKYASACAKIGTKENQVQKRTRTHLIKKMRLYTGDESDDLNTSVEQLKYLLHGIDDTRHQLKSARTTKEVKTKGEAYRSMIRAFNDKANEVQGWIDEVVMVVPLHEHELLKFSREVSVFHDAVYNSLHEVVHRLGYKK